MSHDRRKSIADLFAGGTPIDKALRAAVREAVRRHQQAGLPMAVRRRGKVVLVEPELPARRRRTRRAGRTRDA